jgi:hypothetical protein
MPEATQDLQSALKHQITQMAAELAVKLHEQAQQAPLGSVLAACEDVLLGQGRQFLRDCLAATLQQQADQAEKKGVPLVAVLAVRPAATKGPPPVSS